MNDDPDRTVALEPHGYTPLSKINISSLCKPALFYICVSVHLAVHAHRANLFMLIPACM